MHFITTFEVLSAALKDRPGLGGGGEKKGPAFFYRYSCLHGSVLGCYLSLFKREDCTVLLKI